MRTVVIAMLLLAAVVGIAPTAAADHCQPQSHVWELACRVREAGDTVVVAVGETLCDLLC